MFRILKKSLKTGIVTGQHPHADQPAESRSQAVCEKAMPYRQSLTIREVDTGSCNACEMEMNALANPIYDIERFGVHITASPRHAERPSEAPPAGLHGDYERSGVPRRDEEGESRCRSDERRRSGEARRRVLPG